jgi:hypothetical protein
MDGVLLVFDSRSLPNLHALATVEVPVPVRPHARHRAFSAMAGLLLVTVFSVVYFTSVQRTPPVIAPIPAGVSAPFKLQAPSTQPSTDANAAIPETPKQETKSDPAKSAAPLAKKATAKSPPTQTKPEEPKKDDSKVGSILKKTGRLLKKPFKF